MSQTIYLSDEEEELLLEAIYSKAVLATDKGDDETRDKYLALRDKIEIKSE